MMLDQYSHHTLTALATHLRTQAEQPVSGTGYAVLAAALVLFALVLLKRAVEPIGPLLRAATGFLAALLLLGIALALLAVATVTGG